MNAQIDSFQTWLDLGCATSPGLQRLKSPVGSFKIDLRAATRRVGSTKTGRFVLAKRLLSQNGPFS